MNRFLAIITLGSIYPFAVLPSSACSLAGCQNHGIELPQDFSITITHDGRPLAGVAVVITSFVEGTRTDRFSGLTSSDGTVRVVGLPADDYWLDADLLGISAAYECFHINVQPSKGAKRKLVYDWADDATATQKIAGKLVDSQPGKDGTPLWNIIHRVDVPISGVNLKLQNPITGIVYNTISDSGGEFAFDVIPSGVYVLHLEGGAAGDRAYDGTDLPIKLNPRATRYTLLLRRRDGGGGSCGGTSLELQGAYRPVGPGQAAPHFGA